MRRKVFLPAKRAGVLFAALLLGSPLLAQDAGNQAARPAAVEDPAGFGGMAANADEQVRVTAENLEILDADRIAVFTGNVVVIQGTMEMRAPRLVAVYGEGGPSDLVNFTASGGRVEMMFEDQHTLSDEAFYDFAARILTLSGNVEVTNAGSTVTADQLIVDTRAATSRFSGGSSGGDGRVNAVFQPTGG